MLDAANINTATLEFEVTDYDVDWVSDYSADIGGYDGTLPSVTILEAIVSDGETTFTADRKQLLKLFDAKHIWNAEESIEETLH